MVLRFQSQGLVLAIRCVECLLVVIVTTIIIIIIVIICSVL